MKHHRITSAAALVALGLAAGCGQAERTTAEDVREETAQTYEATRNYASQQRAEFQARVERRMETLDTRIQQLRQQAGEGGEKALAEVAERKREADGALARLRAASAESWDEAKEDVNEALARLEQSLREAMTSVG